MANEAKSTSGLNLSFDPVRISLQQVDQMIFVFELLFRICFQIMIGVIVEVFALFPSLLLVQLFRHVRPCGQQQSPLRQALYKMKGNVENNVNEQKQQQAEEGEKEENFNVAMMVCFYLLWTVSNQCGCLHSIHHCSRH